MSFACCWDTDCFLSLAPASLSVCRCMLLLVSQFSGCACGFCQDVGSCKTPSEMLQVCCCWGLLKHDSATCPFTRRNRDPRWRSESFFEREKCRKCPLVLPNDETDHLFFFKPLLFGPSFTSSTPVIERKRAETVNWPSRFLLSD